MKPPALQPKISIIIPTLNSGKVLTDCLKSIRRQRYDQSLIEIIIADGGSEDFTISIAKKYKCQIFSNPLKTAEAGKALGISHAKGKYIALIDSDNILPTPDWINKMITPLESNPKIIGSEPWQYTYRSNGGFIERYSALTGVNDPYALIANNYDRRNYLRPGWNGLNIYIDDHQYYQSFGINQQLPSIGANGTVYRLDIIKKYFKSDYLIDIDLLSQIAAKSTGLLFAKVKCGIVHTFCESSVLKFFNKQNRRVVDLYIYQNSRPVSYINSQFLNNIKYVLYVVLVFPMFFDTLKGFLKKPDLAWLFHPLACVITLYCYGIGTIKYRLGFLKPINRATWSQ